MSEKQLALKVSNLKKSYKEGKEILHGISFNILKGEFVGILGSNGAGKTTTINCITGISTPTGGDIKVFNHDVVKDYKEARKKIGLSPQEFTVDTFQTVKELLYFQAGFFGIIGKEREERIQNLLNIFELNEHKDKKFQFLSGGLKRRTIVAKSLIHNPDIIILDEPTAGVDVETRQALWKYLELLKKENKTLILTSHYLEEIEALCDRVLIIQNGEIVYEAKMKDIKEKGKLEEVYLKLVENNK